MCCESRLRSGKSVSDRGGAPLRVFALLGLAIGVVALSGSVHAALRDGIDCGCSKTGAYVGLSKGSAPKAAEDPNAFPVTVTEWMSPGDQYRITEGSIGSGPIQTILTIKATGSSATLLQLQYIASETETWGFSPDDDRFVFSFDSATGRTIRLYDLTALASTGGPPLYETELDGVWSVQFARKGGGMVLTSVDGTNGTVFRIVDTSTGDVVFHQGFLPSPAPNTAADFDFGTTPWGFSPNDRYLLYHYVSAATGAQRHYVRVYDLTAPAATQTITYDNAEGSAVLRFSSNSAYLLDTFTTGSNTTALQVRKSSSGALTYSDSFTFTANPGNVGDKFKGAAWGFSPSAGNLLYLVDEGPSAVGLHLVNLSIGQQVLYLGSSNVRSGFPLFSPCGDILATVLQSGGGQQLTHVYSTRVGGIPLYTDTTLLAVLWTFQSTALEHQVSVDGGVWQTTAANDAGDTCTPPVPDTTPPVWDPGATLTAVPGSAHGDVDLSWPAASDADSGVGLYAIYQDGGEIATVSAGTLAYTVSGLASSASHTFEVQAEDFENNRSADGPSAGITLPDFEPPSFAPGDVLVANNLGPDSLDLVWPAAGDDTGVSEYRVYRGGYLFQTLTGATTGLSVTGLDFESDYGFEVEAADASGNVSVRLSLDVTTAGPPASAQPPAWPNGASLTITVTGPDSIDLSWPAAIGPDGVGAYDIHLNGRRIAQVAGDQTSFSLAGLLPDSDWALEIVPRNDWRQPGGGLSGVGHTDPGTHVDPPIPAPLVSDEGGNSDVGRISSDGRHVSFHSTDSSYPGVPGSYSDYLYDRTTGEVVGIDALLLSGDGRHVVRPEIVFDTPPWQYVISIVRDLDTSADTVLYDGSWGPAPDSWSAVGNLDLSYAGDRLLIAVGSAIPGEPYRHSHLMVTSGSAGALVRIAKVGRICPDISSQCERLGGAWLAPDGGSVLYWGSSQATSSSARTSWIKRTTLSGGGTRTLLTPSDLRRVGQGSGDASGLVVFDTTDALLPPDTARTNGPVYPNDLDVYIYDWVTDSLELVSVDAGGAAVGGGTPSVSADGRFVAYEGGPCGGKVIAVRDRWLGTTRCVPVAGQWSTDAWSPILSANGRYLTFESDAVAEQGVHLVDLSWQPPAWPVPPSIAMTGHDFTSIDFTWTPVEDLAQFPAAMGRYEIYRDGAPEASLSFPDFRLGLPSYSAGGLRPATTYSFEVELRDATQSETNDGPQALLSTTTPSADLSLSIVDSPDPIGDAAQLRYEITLSNAGPNTAFDAAFDFSWPSSFGFLAANPMAGSCSRPAADSLTCVVGDLPVGGSALVVVLLSTGAQGAAAVSASASALGSDPVPGNSTGVQESTSVLPGGGGGGLGGGGGGGMVSTGPKHAGAVVGWGDATNGRTSPPESVGQRTARSVAAGVSHSCAIQAETGAVICWGGDTYGESTPPPDVDGSLGAATALAAGDRFACAIQAGTQAVVCWGVNGYGQTTPPASVDGGTGGATAIAAGWSHACAIRADTGGVVCWGANGDRQRTVPSTVNGVLGSATAIAVGRYHSCAIQAHTNHVVCWGARNSNYGQLGVPPEVDGTSGSASAIEAGQYDTCAIQAGSGRVLCWGANWSALAPPPASVDGSDGTASAIAVAGTGCAIQAETGRVVCWGGGGEPPPSQVDGSAGTALALAARQSHFCAIQAGTRAVVCWGGGNLSGETSVPARMNGSGGLATAIAAGADHSCAIAAARDAVVCWGDDTAGQSTVPAGLDGVAGRASALAVGAQHSCAIQSGSGAVICWGSSANGRSTPPADVDGSLGTARGIAAGDVHSCAIQDTSNAVVCWGDDTLGQAAVPAAVDGSAGTASGLATGAAHSCAIQAETGGVVCWGDDASGQASVPAALDGSGGTASAIAAGESHSCAIRAETGGVVCWGSDASGQSTPPAGVDGSAGRAIAISAGGAYSCAVQAASHAVLCWGDASLGQNTPPGSLDGENGRAIGLATGTGHGLALYVPEPAGSALGLAALATLLLLRRSRERR